MSDQGMPIEDSIYKQRYLQYMCEKDTATPPGRFYAKSLATPDGREIHVCVRAPLIASYFNDPSITIKIQTESCSFEDCYRTSNGVTELFRVIKVMEEAIDRVSDIDANKGDLSQFVPLLAFIVGKALSIKTKNISETLDKLIQDILPFQEKEE